MQVIYLGVEWDDATRGKHDGSAVSKATGEAVQHFSCAMGAGSFVKPKMLSRGETFGDVMRRRYVKMDEAMVREMAF